MIIDKNIIIQIESSGNPMCLVDQPIDELSEDGDSCRACYDEDIEVIEEIKKEYKEYNK